VITDPGWPKAYCCYKDVDFSLFTHYSSPSYDKLRYFYGNNPSRSVETNPESIGT